MFSHGNQSSVNLIVSPFAKPLLFIFVQSLLILELKQLSCLHTALVMKRKMNYEQKQK